MNKLYYESSLAHHGIKGQKWGERRFQTKDGSLTPAGRERYDDNDSKKVNRSQKRHEKKMEKKLRYVGRAKGHADYENEKIAESQKKHEDIAKRFDRVAKKNANSGLGIKSDLAKFAADKIRKRSENQVEKRKEEAEYWTKQADKMQAKADKYATKKRVDLGKKQVANAIKKGRDEGYENSKEYDKRQKEDNLREKLGDDRYDKLQKIKEKVR